jgi:hypothetical protein
MFKAHFIKANELKGMDMTAYNNGTKKSVKGGDRRRRKTEKEEDEELLRDEELEEETVTITESPECTL